MEGRVLLGREGVHVAADGVDLFRDALGGAVRGPLEHHVLDEMADAALRVRLVAAAALQPDADGDAAHVRHGLGQESEAIGEDVFLNHAYEEVSLSRLIDAAGTGDIVVSARTIE